MRHDPRLVARVEGAFIRASLSSGSRGEALLDELAGVCLTVVARHQPRSDDGLYPNCPACGCATPDMRGEGKVNGLAPDGSGCAAAED